MWISSQILGSGLKHFLVQLYSSVPVTFHFRKISYFYSFALHKSIMEHILIRKSTTTKEIEIYFTFIHYNVWYFLIIASAYNIFIWKSNPPTYSETPLTNGWRNKNVYLKTTTYTPNAIHTHSHILVYCCNMLAKRNY